MGKKIDLRGWSLNSMTDGLKEAKALVAKKTKDNKEYEYIAVKDETRSKNTGKDAYSIYGRLAKPYYVTAI
jgi:hypothetical protein